MLRCLFTGFTRSSHTIFVVAPEFILFFFTGVNRSVFRISCVFSGIQDVANRIRINIQIYVCVRIWRSAAVILNCNVSSTRPIELSPIRRRRTTHRDEQLRKLAKRLQTALWNCGITIIKILRYRCISRARRPNNWMFRLASQRERVAFGNRLNSTELFFVF